MKKLILLLTAILLCLCLAGCGEKTPLSGTFQVGQDPLPYSEEELFNQLFDRNNKISFSIDMDKEELWKLQQDYDRYSAMGSKSPIYRMADVTITIETPEGSVCSYVIRQVGVRMKGNTSRTDFYSREEGIYNHIHLKLDFQETFDDEDYYGSEVIQWTEDAREERKDRTFATLEKLDLRWNKCDDSTYLRELYAYDIFRDYGVIAPHMNLTSLSWAGIHMGIYSINEPVDKIFLEKNLPQEQLGGDLYKCGWAGGLNASFTDVFSIGIEDEDNCEFYAFDLKTNKKTSDHSALKKLILTLNQGNITKEDLASLVDMESFLNYCAVAYFLGNPDDMRNNYNNFYLYFRGDTGQAIIIPYDFDRCLGITKHWNPSTTAGTDDDPFTTERMAVDRLDESADRLQRNPLILYTVAEGGYFLDEYARCLENVASGKWLTLENFAQYFHTGEALYGDEAVPEKRMHNGWNQDYNFEIDRSFDFTSTDNISFRKYVRTKLAAYEIFREKFPDYPRNNPIVLSGCCIRADFTNWEVDPTYTLTADGDTYVITLKVTQQVRLKVYTRQNDRWYGSECVTPETAVTYTTDPHTNIVLQAGAYRIRFDPETAAITLEPAEGA